MSVGLPARLAKAPIVTAIFEMRFDSQVDGLADLLPGMLYSTLGPRFPKIQNFPFSQLAPTVRETVPDWQFQSASQLASVDGRTNVNFSNRSLNVQMLLDYPGWNAFIDAIRLVVDAVAALKTIGPVIRYSLRYQNILGPEVLRSIDELNVKVDLGGTKPAAEGLSVRGEYDYEGLRTIVTVANNVNFNLTINGAQHVTIGTLVDVDVMDLAPPSDFFERHVELLTNVHNKEKAIFFNLLQKQVIDRLGPVWETVNG